MALRDLFKKRTRTPSTDGTGRVGAGVPSYLSSPWASTSPEALVYADIFGEGEGPLANRHTRLDAMKVPAIMAARNRVIEHLAGRPIVDYLTVNTAGMKPGEQVDETSGRVLAQPDWMTRTDDPLSMSPHQRLVNTLDDLIFDGMSLWAVTREGGEIGRAMHVPFGWWSLTPDGEVVFDGETTNPDEVILIPGPHAGLLNLAQDTIQGGLDIERAWRSRARNPAPTMVLREREDNGMTPEEAKPYVEAVAQARRNPDGAVMFIPYKIELEIPAAGSIDHLESARNAIRLDVASYFDFTAQGVEASKAQSTLTYETAEQAEQQTADRMAFWSEPIEARLSMDDVVPTGHRVRFDFTDINRSTTGTPTED